MDTQPEATETVNTPEPNPSPAGNIPGQPRRFRPNGETFFVPPSPDPDPPQAPLRFLCVLCASALNSISRIPGTPSLRARIAKPPSTGIHSMDNQTFVRRSPRQGQLL